MFLLPKNILIILKCNGCSNENLKGAGHLDAEGIFASGSCSKLQRATRNFLQKRKIKQNFEDDFRRKNFYLLLVINTAGARGAPKNATAFFGDPGQAIRPTNGR